MYGELGNGVATANNVNPTTPNPNPVQFSGVTNAVGVTVGASHTCVILGDLTVECVGYRRWGLLGDGTPDSSTNYYTSIPVKVSGITNAIPITVNSTKIVLSSVSSSPKSGVPKQTLHVCEGVTPNWRWDCLSSLSFDYRRIKPIRVRREVYQTLHNSDSVLELNPLRGLLTNLWINEVIWQEAVPTLYVPIAENGCCIGLVEGRRIGGNPCFPHFEETEVNSCVPG